MKTVNAKDTRFPTLTRSILRNLDRDQLRDVARHGADAGWPGFTYHSDTVKFFKTHKADILALAKQMADDLGSEGMIHMVQNFRCLCSGANSQRDKPDYSSDEVAEAIYGRGDKDVAQLVQNALAWFALEEVARELNPDL